ncbi:MAG: hydroxyacid dehydrogenase [Lachnospiraceae bacterium]|nr:hydroxyacid dehydrogenase [Lachnospiraceae bacterium]
MREGRIPVEAGRKMEAEKKVLVTEPVDEAGTNLLKAHGFEVVQGTGIEQETVIREAQGCGGILTRNARITADVMDHCPELRVIGVHGVGVDIIDVEAATARKIQVVNAAGSNREAVAEYAMSLILMLAKGSVQYNNELKAGNLEIRKMKGENVQGKTLGILGMGNIGTQVARIAHGGFGMEVFGYNRHISEPQKLGFCTLLPDKEEVIRRADFLSLHLPLTASTRHIIGERELELMKPTAYLVNTGRGEIVDEQALIRALQEKRIRGAGLDVFEGGLPKPENPLLHMDNVIVSPHTAAFTVESLRNMARQAAQGIAEVLENRAPSWPVNRIPGAPQQKKVSCILDYYQYEFGTEAK